METNRFNLEEISHYPRDWKVFAAHCLLVHLLCIKWVPPSNLGFQIAIINEILLGFPQPLQIFRNSILLHEVFLQRAGRPYSVLRLTMGWTVRILNPGIKGKVHPCTGTETLYRPYGPYGE